jgi:hypothetical protein
MAIVATMWNHAQKMEQELRRLGRAWPRFAPGEAADLAAFLIAKRPGGGAIQSAGGRLR